MLEFLAAIIIFIFLTIFGIFVFQKNNKIRNELSSKENDLARREKNTKQKMYEIAILNKLSDKMGYSLGVQNVIEIITGSLREFVDYKAMSYMLFTPEKIIFRNYLENSLPHRFITGIKEKMLDSASALLNENLKDKNIEETVWGADLNDEIDEAVGSFFNIPLVISGKTTGLLTVSDSRPGFYKEEEMTALYKIAKQASDAVTRLQNIVESEKSKMNAAVASMTDGVVMTDADYNILAVNPAAKMALGFEDRNDLSITDFNVGLQKSFDLKDKIDESLRLEKNFLSEEIILGKGFFKISVSPVKDSWKTLGCVIVFRDMTREKEVERIKEDFTSMIVHELRSPLDSIKKMIGSMRSSELKKTERAECYQMIYGSSSDMLELINNLLDIAKIEAGKFELIKQKSDIKKTIESRIMFFDIAAKDAKVKLASTFAKDLPEMAEFDPRTISQVLNNLISNAIKFTKENGNITIQALLHKKGESLEREAKDARINWFIKNNFSDVSDSLVVAVTDTGIGIAPDQISKLFNKFIQAKTNFVEKGGTGLGLAITKSIIDSHGGMVGAESVEGKGSTFYFTLPIV